MHLVPDSLEAEAVGKPIFLFGVKDFPNFQRLVSFRFRKELVKQAYQAAKVSPGAFPSGSVKRGFPQHKKLAVRA